MMLKVCQKGGKMQQIHHRAAEMAKMPNHLFRNISPLDVALWLGTEGVFLHDHVATTIATALDSPNHKKSIGTENCLSDAIFGVKNIDPISFFVSVFLPALN